MKTLLALALAACSLMAQPRGSVLLESHTANNTAALNFTAWYSATYDEYQIEFVSLIPAYNNVPINIQMSTDGGATYDSAAIYDSFGSYTWAGNISAYSSPGQTAVQPFGADVGIYPGYASSGTLKLMDPGNPTIYKVIHGQTFQYNSYVGPLEMMWAGVYRNMLPVNAFQVSAGTGTFYGTVRVYGLTK